MIYFFTLTFVQVAYTRKHLQTVVRTRTLHTHTSALKQIVSLPEF